MIWNYTDSMSSTHRADAERLYEEAHAALTAGNSDEALMAYDQGIQALYEELAQERSGTVDAIMALPRDDLDSFFKRDDLAAKLMCEKAVASLNSGDPALAEQLLGDSIEALPQGSAYTDPFAFLSLVHVLRASENDTRADYAMLESKDLDKPFSLLTSGVVPPEAIAAAKRFLQA